MFTGMNPHMKSVKSVLLTSSATKVNRLAKVNIMRRFHASIPPKPLALPWLHNKGEGAIWISNDLDIFDGDSSLHQVPQIQYKPLDILGKVGRNSLLHLQNPQEAERLSLAAALGSRVTVVNTSNVEPLVTTLEGESLALKEDLAVDLPEARELILGLAAETFDEYYVAPLPAHTLPPAGEDTEFLPCP